MKHKTLRERLMEAVSPKDTEDRKRYRVALARARLSAARMQRAAAELERSATVAAK